MDGTHRVSVKAIINDDKIIYVRRLCTTRSLRKKNIRECPVRPSIVSFLYNVPTEYCRILREISAWSEKKKINYDDVNLCAHSSFFDFAAFTTSCVSVNYTLLSGHFMYARKSLLVAPTRLEIDQNRIRIID